VTFGSNKTISNSLNNIIHFRSRIMRMRYI